MDAREHPQEDAVQAWLTRTSDGKYPITRISVPHETVPCDLSKPAAGVGHTTEGSWEGALSVFREHYAPNFMVGKDAHGAVRIVQFVPVSFMAAALENHYGGLETNRWARAQVELVGYTSSRPWLPAHDVALAYASLLDTLRHVAGIPLSRPFPDTLEPGVEWATESNPRRRAGKWGKVAGWWSHLEIPENAHWDCGALQWRELFALVGAAPSVVGYTMTSTWRDGKQHSVDIKDYSMTFTRASDGERRALLAEQKQRGPVIVRRRFDS